MLEMELRWPQRNSAAAVVALVVAAVELRREDSSEAEQVREAIVV